MNKMRYENGEARRAGRTVQEIMASFSRFFLPYLNCEDSNVLDIGAGNGRFSFALSAFAKKVIAIDSHDTQNEIYKRKNIDFLNVKFEEFAINIKFDLCFMWGVWYYLFTREDQDEMFDRLMSMLSESGVIVIIDDVHSKIQTTDFIEKNKDKVEILAIDDSGSSDKFCLVVKKLGENSET